MTPRRNHTQDQHDLDRERAADGLRPLDQAVAALRPWKVATVLLCYGRPLDALATIKNTNEPIAVDAEAEAVSLIAWGLLSDRESLSLTTCRRRLRAALPKTRIRHREAIVRSIYGEALALTIDLKIIPHLTTYVCERGGLVVASTMGIIADSGIAEDTPDGVHSVEEWLIGASCRPLGALCVAGARWEVAGLLADDEWTWTLTVPGACPSPPTVEVTW